MTHLTLGQFFTVTSRFKHQSGIKSSIKNRFHPRDHHQAHKGTPEEQVDPDRTARIEEPNRAGQTLQGG
ncbi:hypothetical protein ABT278_38695 [Streptomyces sp. NPDC001228]|uniref:hypothetical protein n=1 Tax=Streptomyces sp. NPDC001228 TaxID=3154381 RepID=UPI00332324D5